MFEKDPVAQHSYLKLDIRSPELILTLRRRIWWIIVLCLIAFSFTFWYSKRYYTYQSKVTVDVSPAPVFLNYQEGPKQSIDMFRNSEYVMRVLQFAHSDKMAEHLIKKFDLYKHYGINPDSKYANERMNIHLDNVIQVKKSMFENVLITVSDANRDFAATMANEVAAETDLLAREYISSALSAKLVYYEEILKNLNDDFAAKSESSSKILSTIYDLKASSRNNPELESKLSSIESQLNANISRMDEIIQQIAESKKSQTWIISMLHNENLKFISIMQKALPDQSNLLFPRIVLGLVSMVAASWLAVLFIYFAKTYRRYFRLFFFK